MQQLPCTKINQKKHNRVAAMARLLEAEVPTKDSVAVWLLLPLSVF